MSRAGSLASSGASRERQLPMKEPFGVLSASLGARAETRLQRRPLQQRYRLPLRNSNPIIATALSPSGRLAVATSSDIRLYDLENQDRAQAMSPSEEFSIKVQSKNERIRSIAISDDLLAVVTHCRLIVYDYKDAPRVEDSWLEDIPIDQNDSWTPRSVSVMQVLSADARQSAVAWIAVGGEGVNGVKLFQYSYSSGWNADRDFRTILKCPQNTSSVRSVGFSQFVRMDNFTVFGVTSDNRIFCWDLQPRDYGSPVTVSGWELDGSSRHNGHSQRGEISSIVVFQSPSGMPYIFCAVDQRHGSQLVRSFLAPLEHSASDHSMPRLHWRALPESVAGRSVLSAAVTPNGRYIVTVEEGIMRLLTLCGAYDGGLTCKDHALKWETALEGAAKDISGISLSVKETQGHVEIAAVDGRGHLAFARISVPDMPVSAPPSLARRASTVAVELPAESIESVAGAPWELSAEEGQQPQRSDSKLQANWDRLADDIRVILG